MKRLPNDVKKCCAHYIERMSECRNCEYSDAVFKECYKKRKEYSNKEKQYGFEK